MCSYFFEAIAQLVEQHTFNVRALGSNPSRFTTAQMAELVDALDSGSSDFTVVQVRFLFWAHRYNRKPHSAGCKPAVFAQMAELVDAPA